MRMMMMGRGMEIDGEMYGWAKMVISHATNTYLQ